MGDLIEIDTKVYLLRTALNLRNLKEIVNL